MQRPDAVSLQVLGHGADERLAGQHDGLEGGLQRRAPSLPIAVLIARLREALAVQP